MDKIKNELFVAFIIIIYLERNRKKRLKKKKNNLQTIKYYTGVSNKSYLLVK